MMLETEGTPMHYQLRSVISLIDPSDLRQAVTALLGDDQPAPRQWRIERVGGGLGVGTEVFRVSGTTSAKSPDRRSWTIIVKVLTPLPLSFQSTGADTGDWNYWKRELSIYQSPWQQQLSGSVRAPRCLATGEVTASSEPLAWIALEDVTDGAARPWRTSIFTAAAHHLGVFNAEQRQVSSDSPPGVALSSGWIRGWAEQAAGVIDQLPQATAHPVAGRIFTPEIVHELLHTWENRAKYFAALDQLPKTIGHNDFFPRNVFVRTGHSVAIDWANCGFVAIGEELSALVGASQVFQETSPDRWDALEHACLRGYHAGLRAGSAGSAGSGGSGGDGGDGSDGGDAVEAGYLLSSAVRFGIGSLPPALGLTMTAEHRDVVGRVFGCSFDTFVSNVAALMRFQVSRIRRARALIGL